MTRFSSAALSRKRTSQARTSGRLLFYSCIATVAICTIYRSLQSDSTNPLQSSLRQAGVSFPQVIPLADYESIPHPYSEYTTNEKDGGKVLHVDVPKLWDPPQFARFGGVREYLGSYGKRIMTPEEALSIGSKVTVTTPKKEKLQLETIVVALASYRDWMCPRSVEGLFERAKYPERLRVVIIDQIVKGNDTSCSEPLKPCEEHPEQALCQFSKDVDVLTMDASLASGPIFARHLGHRFYRGEYFFMQSDAHIQMTRDWDVEIVSQWKMAKNEMAVLTTYPNPVDSFVNETSGQRLNKSRPMMCDTRYEDKGDDRHLRHDQQPSCEAVIKGEPQLQPLWAAGFSFSRGHFIVNIPYDQHIPLVFQGEETSIGVRGFTYGYDFYAPEHSIMFHYYTRPANPNVGTKAKASFGVTIPKYWDKETSNDKHVELTALGRLNGIIHLSNPGVSPDTWRHDDEQFYGIGNVRRPELFYGTFGIHTETQTIEENLCMFVAGGAMHTMFRPHLREDGMGINYSNLKGYQFKDTWSRPNYWFDGSASSEESSEVENGGNEEGEEAKEATADDDKVLDSEISGNEEGEAAKEPTADDDKVLDSEIGGNEEGEAAKEPTAEVASNDDESNNEEGLDDEEE